METIPFIYFIMKEFKHKKYYKTDIRKASFEITLTKLEGPHKESKEPTKPFLRNQTAREWTAKFAFLKLH